MTDKNIKFGEFIALMALYVALMAMSIDTILPALSIIGNEFGVTNENHAQYIIGVLFLGFTFGQIFYGPLADSFGRKKTVYVGVIIFIIGNILCTHTEEFSLMLLGRFLQGFGAASPRIMAVAITRDLYKGREMARVISFIMTIFLIIPVVAPSFGQSILFVASWKTIFNIFLLAAVIIMIWTYFRLPETLKKTDIKKFNFKVIIQDFSIVLKNKITLGYATCAGLIFGALTGYLISSRQIFQDYFETGELFPLYFAASAISLGIASLINSAIVRKYGMRLICEIGIIATIAMSAIFLPLSFMQDQMPLWVFMIYILITFFCLGLQFGNLNALAMEPMGHYAGTASSVVGFISSGVSVATGTLIGQSYNNTLHPMFIGFLILSSFSFMILKLLKKEN